MADAAERLSAVTEQLDVEAPSRPGKPLIATQADKRAIEARPLADRDLPTTTIDLLRRSAARFPNRPALSFQLKGAPSDPVFTLTYAEFLREITRAANALVANGARVGEPIALLMPNLPETAIAAYAAQAVGSVVPINPLLEPAIIAGILEEAGATTIVTLAPFPKTDVAEKAAEAAALSGGVARIIEVDLLRYLKGPLRYVAPFLRPKRVGGHGAAVIDFHKIQKGIPDDRFTFERDLDGDAIGAAFHTGGTTGTPKLAPHRQSGMVFNGWMAGYLLFNEEDVFLCALPLFHVLASYPMALSAFSVGAHLVLVTPAGFRGDGVMDSYWKLVERYRATFFCAVPTAISVLDQKPINADVSSLRYLISGSAALPTALFRRFEESTGVKILEGYGMTEATCVTSCNPPDGERRIGSVGVPIPYVQVRICVFDGEGGRLRDCDTDEIGEICFQSPSVFPGYSDARLNEKLFFDQDDPKGPWLRTGDLGRVDADGYIWITGRAKDLIIRGGHNIDPGLIEEAISKHPEVAFVGAIGQPDAYAGELPCAYVELKQGATVTAEALKAFADEHVSERAARPAIVEILDELPKTAVGKTFKPALRQKAMARVFDKALNDAGVQADVDVIEDKTLGMVGVIRPASNMLDENAVEQALSGFSRPWRIGR